jgi:hypothetical protein
MPFNPANPVTEVQTTTSSWKYAAVTKSDSTDFDVLCRAIYVGGAGNVVAVMYDGTAVTFTGVPAGTLLPIACRRINSTDTTATSMVALF